MTLDRSAAEAGDQIESAFQCRCRDALPSMALPDEMAGDTPVRRRRLALLVRRPVLDPGQLAGCSKLAPADAVVAVEDQRRVRCPALDSISLTVYATSPSDGGTLSGTESPAPGSRVGCASVSA